MTPKPEISPVTLKKSETATVVQSEASDVLVKTTMVPDVEVNTIGMESKEIEEGVRTATFDTTDKNMEINDGIEESKNEFTEPEDTSPVEVSQIPTTAVEIGSKSSEETQAPVENAILDAENEPSATPISTSTENVEITTSELMIDDSLTSDKTFEGESAIAGTDSGKEISGSVSSNGVEVKAQPTEKHGEIHAAIESIHQSAAVNEESTSATTEESNIWHKSTTETRVSDDALQPGSEPKMEFDGAKSVGADSTENKSEEAFTTPLAGTVEKNENEVEQLGSSTVMSSSINAEIVEFNEDLEAIDDGSSTKAKSSERQGAFEDHIEAESSGGSTEAKSSNLERPDETSSNLSTLTSSEQNKKNNALASNDTAEVFYTFLKGALFLLPYNCDRLTIIDVAFGDIIPLF